MDERPGNRPEFEVGQYKGTLGGNTTINLYKYNNKFVKASLNKSSKALSCEFTLPNGDKHVRQALIDGDASKSWIQIAQMLVIVFDYCKTLGNFKRFRPELGWVP
jgi:hypothetical protein